MFARLVGSHLVGFELDEGLALLLKRGLPNPTMPPPAPLLVMVENPPEELDGPLLYEELATGSEAFALPKPCMRFCTQSTNCQVRADLLTGDEA